MRVAMAGVLIGLAIPVETAADSRPLGLSGRPIIVPHTVSVYRHTSVTDADFVTPLLERLRATFVPVVESRETAFDYSPAERSLLGQYEAFQVLERFHEATAVDPPSGTFRILLISEDIRQKHHYNFLFAFSYGSETTAEHLMVVSLARLTDGTWGVPQATRSRLIAGRVFKLVAKNVARMGGFVGSGGCILGFSRSVEELDLIPPRFCDEDASVLTGAGLLKP